HNFNVNGICKRCGTERRSTMAENGNGNGHAPGIPGAPPGQLPPKCPSCRQDITSFAHMKVVMGSGVPVQFLYCSNNKCRHLFTAQLMSAKAEPKLITEAPSGLIIKGG
ncbi:MAG: hypothetical protein ACRDQZ_25420, partial [Mycobacteriales bacterium]